MPVVLLFTYLEIIIYSLKGIEVLVLGYGNNNEIVNEIIEILKEKLVKDYERGFTKRDAHPKELGILKGSFIVDKYLNKELETEVFKAGKEYNCFIRFSSGGNKVRSDKNKDIRGMAIKLIEVNGEKLLDDEKQTQDFLMLTIPTMPIGTLSLFRDFIYYIVKKKNPIALMYKLFRRDKLNIIKELIKARENQTSPLDVGYFSTTPYVYKDKIVKFCVKPKSKYKSDLPKRLTYNYLSENMQKHLIDNEAIFDFYIQIQTNTDLMPIDDASIEWDEKESPFIKIGKIIIPRQWFISDNRSEMGENLSFSPGHCSVEHRPVGDINLARVEIYRQLSEFRHKRNDRWCIEPTIEDFKNLK